MQAQHQMAQMVAMSANGGPVDGTPMMNHMAQKRNQTDPREQINTYIYDYFLRNEHYAVARAMLDSGMKMNTGQTMKPNPTNRSNGVDSLGPDEEFPSPGVPTNQLADNSFLLDWWVQFWDIFQAAGSRTGPSKGAQYVNHTRNLAQFQNEQRNARMMMNTPMAAQYQPGLMRGGLTNGVAPNDLKRAAAMNNRPGGNAMGIPIKNPLVAAHMQRDPSNMEMNGQRPQSPGSNENAPSPNKRPRVEGGIIPVNGQGAQFGEFTQGQNLQHQKMESMNSASPMPQQLDDQADIFTGNQPRPSMSNNAPGAPQQGNHALQDYQMQLMLLEQQNKKRLLMARQEQDNMSVPHQPGAVGAPAFGTDPRNRGTPKMGQQGSSSPMPEGGMPQQRGSPAPGMAFDPGLAPPGMPPQYYPGSIGTPMMRPPSSHPNGNFNGQQATPQQIETMRNQQMQNGAWRGPSQPGMMPGQQPMNGPMGQNPQQQRSMAPPPAPSEQPRPEASPAPSNQAPPTPSHTNKANPKKKPTKDNKKPANKKGATGANSAANGEEPPTPTSSTPVAPITSVHGKTFSGQNGAAPPNVQPQPAQPAMDNTGPPFGNLDADPSMDASFLTFPEDSNGLEGFDFDTYLHTGNDNDTFGSGFDFDLGGVTEEVGGM